MKYEDLLKSDVATSNKIDNTPDNTAKSNLTLLKINILDRIPHYFSVTSGYKWLQKQGAKYKLLGVVYLGDTFTKQIHICRHETGESCVLIDF
jgi:hypothetical protein